MSFQWIPAQIDIESRPNGTDSDSFYTGFKPGYYLGKETDNGYYIINTYGYSNFGYNPSEQEAWVMTRYPFHRFLVSAFTSADDAVDSFYMTPNVTNGVGMSIRDSSNQYTYFGKPVYYGGGYCLKYSPSEGKYIIVAASDEKPFTEPTYSTNVLSGGLSGDYFWKGTVDELYLNSGTTYSNVTFSLTGASDEYKSYNDDYIDHFTLESKVDCFKCTTPASLSARTQRPAGEYTNEETGEKRIVGSKSYMGGDGSLWYGHSLSGRFQPPYWESLMHGRITYRANTTYWGNAWVGSESQTELYVYPNAQNPLPNSFTLRRYKWNVETSTYDEIVSAAIAMEKGPYYLLSSESTILMGECSQWR